MNESPQSLSLTERAHFLHRAYRFRYVSEPFGVRYALSRDLRDGVALDIGANRGVYSYWMHSRLGPRGRVVAFEPQPELNADLHRLRRAFRLDHLVIAGCGLSSESREAVLHVPKENVGWASVVEEENPAPNEQHVSTRVMSLDDYFAENDFGPVRFLKCDVEGHEPSVFRGGRELLERDRPEILVECHQGADPDNETFTVLRESGYAGYCFAPGGLEPAERFAELLPTLHKRAKQDFVFVPQEQTARLAA